MMKKISSWRRWEIYLETKWWKDIATKKALDESKKASINKEILLLWKLNNNNVKFVPQLIESADWEFSYEFIKWDPFNKVFQKSDRKKQDKIVLDLIEKTYQLDKLWIIHWELIRPYSNVLVSENDEVFIIDFERGYLWDFSGKNLRSLSQWLMAQNYLSLKDVKVMRTLNDVNLLHDFILSSLEYWKNTKETEKIEIVYYIIMLFCLDILTKYLFFDLWSGKYLPFIKPIINVWISWSIPLNINVSILLSFIALIVFIYLFKKKVLGKYVFILLFAWSLWNMFDRIFLWWVRDFINIWFWPIFNFADIYLSVAVIIIALKEFVFEKKNK